MKHNKHKTLHIAAFITLLLTVIVSAVGLFGGPAGEPYLFTNQYGDAVKIYGSGLYRNDSFFKAPIFRGTDMVVLLLVCPLLVVALYKDVRLRSIKTRVFLLSLTASVLYYATSISFGVVYNKLHLVYIALFAFSFFGTVAALMSLYGTEAGEAVKPGLPHTGVMVFLSLTGAALFLAWLPDILLSLSTGHSLTLIENYTTEITYVLDMGIIAPLCFITIFLLRRRSMLGYLLLNILLVLCIIIGVMLPVQTFFQVKAGIDMPVPVLITKVATFCLLSLFALYFRLRLKWAVKPLAG